MYIHSLVTKILNVNVIIQDNTGHKTYRRYILLTVNSVHKLNVKNIKYIYKILNTTYLVREKEKKN